MRINLFIPCHIDQYAPQTVFRLLQLLDFWKVEVAYNPQQPCCGRVFYENGNFGEARQMAHDLLNGFEPEIPIVTCSIACVSYVKKNLPTLLCDEEKLSFSIQTLTERFFSLEEWLLSSRIVDFSQAVFPHKVIFQNHCRSARQLPLHNAVQTVLATIQDLELLDNFDKETCCGGGGFFSARNEQVAKEMARNKVEALKKSGAEYLIFDDFDCYWHMKYYLDEHSCGMYPILFSDFLHKVFIHE